MKGICFFFLITFFALTKASDLPLFYINDMEDYLGGFRVCDMNYAQGPFAIDVERNSLFAIGHTHHQQIAEYPLPNLVKSSTITDLERTCTKKQDYVNLLSRVTNGNPEGIDSIGGLYIHNNQIIVNSYEYYDAPGDNYDTTMVIRDKTKLNSSIIDGFYQMEGRAHTCGWISDIPSNLQSELGGTHITGFSSGIPIISRLSVGPSAFLLNPNDFTENSKTNGTIETTKLLDFSLSNKIGGDIDLSNTDLTNKLWTHLSKIDYGFIPEGTRTYVTLGSNGGTESGVCYKCTQDSGRLCGGYCSYEAADNSLYYWLWDINDLLRVKNGEIESYDVLPYKYGKFDSKFPATSLGAGYYNKDTNQLYLSLAKADTEAGEFSNPPIFIVYQLPSKYSGIDPEVLDATIRITFVISSIIIGVVVSVVFFALGVIFIISFAFCHAKIKEKAIEVVKKGKKIQSKNTNSKV